MLINKNDNVVYMTMTSREYEKLIHTMENSLICMENYYRDNSTDLKNLYEQIRILKGWDK